MHVQWGFCGYLRNPTLEVANLARRVGLNSAVIEQKRSDFKPTGLFIKLH